MDLLKDKSNLQRSSSIAFARNLKKYVITHRHNTHVSGTAQTAVFFSGVIFSNRESNKMYLSANVSTFLIAALEVGNLFCDKYR